MPEEPQMARLEELLTVAPYKAPKKIVKKKKDLPEAREGLRPRGHLDHQAGDAAALSVQDGEEEEDGEESASPRPKKRAASEGVEEELPPRAPKRQCRPKLVLPKSSDSDEESISSEEVPEKDLRVKPPAARYEPWYFCLFILFCQSFTDSRQAYDSTARRMTTPPS